MTAPMAKTARHKYLLLIINLQPQAEMKDQVTMNKNKMRSHAVKSNPAKAPTPKADSHIAAGGELHQCAGGEGGVTVGADELHLSLGDGSMRQKGRATSR